MNPEQKIFLIDKNTTGSTIPAQAKSIPLNLDSIGLAGLHIAFIPGQGSLTELVLLARQLSDLIIASQLKKLSQQGITVSCQKACHAACCKHLLVSLSVPEAFAMIEETAHLPENQRKTAVNASTTAANDIRSRLAKSAPQPQNQNRNDLLDRYMELNVPCPYLVDNCCSIYDRRPIICRECLVTSPAGCCQSDGSGTVAKVDFPIRIANVLTQLAAEIFGTNDEIVALPCVFDWFQTTSERYHRRWPRQALVSRFVEIAHEQLNKWHQRQTNRLSHSAQN